MSWSMWHEEGLGFDTTNVSIDKLKGFFKKHEEALHKIKLYNDLMEEIKRDDIMIDKVREFTDNFTIGEIIAWVMTVETGIQFCSPGLSDDSEEAVLFTRCFPWEYNDREKTLTEDTVKEIMKPYSNELGIENIDFIDLTFSG